MAPTKVPSNPDRIYKEAKGLPTASVTKQVEPKYRPTARRKEQLLRRKEKGDIPDYIDDDEQEEGSHIDPIIPDEVYSGPIPVSSGNFTQVDEDEMRNLEQEIPSLETMLSPQPDRAPSSSSPIAAAQMIRSITEEVNDVKTTMERTIQTIEMQQATTIDQMKELQLVVGQQGHNSHEVRTMMTALHDISKSHEKFIQDAAPQLAMATEFLGNLKSTDVLVTRADEVKMMEEIKDQIVHVTQALVMRLIDDQKKSAKVDIQMASIPMDTDIGDSNDQRRRKEDPPIMGDYVNNHIVEKRRPPIPGDSDDEDLDPTARDSRKKRQVETEDEEDDVFEASMMNLMGGPVLFNDGKVPVDISIPYKIPPSMTARQVRRYYGEKNRDRQRPRAPDEMDDGLSRESDHETKNVHEILELDDILDENKRVLYDHEAINLLDEDDYEQNYGKRFSLLPKRDYLIVDEDTDDDDVRDDNSTRVGIVNDNGYPQLFPQELIIPKQQSNVLQNFNNNNNNGFNNNNNNGFNNNNDLRHLQGNTGLEDVYVHVDKDGTIEIKRRKVPRNPYHGFAMPSYKGDGNSVTSGLSDEADPVSNFLQRLAQQNASKNADPVNPKPWRKRQYDYEYSSDDDIDEYAAEHITGDEENDYYDEDDDDDSEKQRDHELDRKIMRSLLWQYSDDDEDDDDKDEDAMPKRSFLKRVKTKHHPSEGGRRTRTPYINRFNVRY
jgi:hypothetical protein